MASDYLCGVLNLEVRKLVVKQLVKKIKETGLRFDSIVFRGMSGAIIAPYIADELKKNLILCRKSEQCHSFHSIEYVSCDIGPYIVIDDLICSGKTILNIAQMVDEEWSIKERARQVHAPQDNEIERPKCVGIFLYHDKYPPKKFVFKDYCRNNSDCLTIPIDIQDFYTDIPVYAFYDGDIKSP